MREPRIFPKEGKYFGIAFHLPGQKHAKKLSTHIPLDVKFKETKKGAPLWWESSEHAGDLRKIIKQIKDDRRNFILQKKFNIEPPPELPLEPKKAPSLWDLLKEFNEANEGERGARSARTFEYRKASVHFLLSYDPGATIELLTPNYVRGLRLWAEPQQKDKPKKRTAREGKGYAPKSIKGYFTEIHALWRYAWRERYISRELDDPFERIIIPVISKKKRRVPIEEQYAIFRYLYEYKRPLFYQSLFERMTGFRVSDVIKFRKDQIDLKNNDLLYWNHKAKRDEVMPISKPMAMLLEMQMPPFEYKSPNTVWAYLRKVTDHLGLEKMNPHLLKACYAQEIRPHCPNSTIFDALMHHAPSENKIAVLYYLDEGREGMVAALEKAQHHWIGFLRSLEEIPEKIAPFNWGKPNRKRDANRVVNLSQRKTASRKKPSEPL